MTYNTYSPLQFVEELSFPRYGGTAAEKKAAEMIAAKVNAVGSADLMPFTIVPGATALSTATAGAAPVKTMAYGDPANYELGLFGDYSVRVDGSYKAGERQNTILGDVKVGGNLVVHHGFVVVTLPAVAGE